MNLNPTTMLRGDLRSRGVAGGARNLAVRPPERTRGQRSEMGFARTPSSNAGPSFSLQLVQGRDGRLCDNLRAERRPCRGDGNEHGTGAFSASWLRSNRRTPGPCGQAGFDAVNRGWVEITRPWHLLTTNSGSGDPRAATAAKGESLTRLVAERIGRFLAELASKPASTRHSHSDAEYDHPELTLANV